MSHKGIMNPITVRKTKKKKKTKLLKEQFAMCTAHHCYLPMLCDRTVWPNW